MTQRIGYCENFARWVHWQANQRVTLYKNCSGVSNPGQAYCIIVNLNHPRFINAVSGTKHKKQSDLTVVMLQGIQDDSG